MFERRVSSVAVILIADIVAQEHVHVSLLTRLPLNQNQSTNTHAMYIQNRTDPDKAAHAAPSCRNTNSSTTASLTTIALANSRQQLTGGSKHLHSSPTRRKATQKHQTPPSPQTPTSRTRSPIDTLSRESRNQHTTKCRRRSQSAEPEQNHVP